MGACIPGIIRLDAVSNYGNPHIWEISSIERTCCDWRHTLADFHWQTPGPLTYRATYVSLPARYIHTKKRFILIHLQSVGIPKQQQPALVQYPLSIDLPLCYKKTRNSGSLTFVRSITAAMGGGESDYFLEGSVLGASFWRWWNRAWTGAPADAGTSKEEQVKAPEQEFVYIAAVVPRPRPPRRPAKSKPIDIPVKKPVPLPVFEEVAEDKRYWYQ